MPDRGRREPENLDDRIGQLRLALLRQHAELPSTGELDPAQLAAAGETIEEIFTLTDELLGLEAAAAEQRDAAEHAQSSRVIYAAAGALGVVSALLLVLALSFGWYSGWGLVVLVANLVVAVGMIGIHAAADRVGHQERCLSALVALGLGVLVAAIAPWWLPWWAAIAALLVMLLNGVVFASELLEQR